MALKDPNQTTFSISAANNKNPFARWALPPRLPITTVSISCSAVHIGSRRRA